MMKSQEIFGAEVQCFRTEPRYWKTLIGQLKDTGLGCLTTYVQWGTHLVGPPDAKHPAGVLDFTGKTNPSLNLIKFLDLVQESGLNLNFRSGPFCCNEMVHGGYPPWLVLGDPNMMGCCCGRRPSSRRTRPKRNRWQASSRSVAGSSGL